MNRVRLSEYFEGVGVKKLSGVDAEPKRSNQHEIGAIAPMRHFLGDERAEFDVTYIWLADEQESIVTQGGATYYDTRVGKPRSPEFRLYYTSNPVTEIMQAGDSLFLAIRPDKSLLFVVVPSESTIQNQLLWLFGLEHQPELTFTVQNFEENDSGPLDFVSRFILDEIGIEFEDPNANTLDSIVERFGTQFPTTHEFSQVARLTLPGVDARDDADAALMAWLTHEEAMFRRLERRIVSVRIEQGFMDDGDVDVDGFIRFSLGVQNRRKARMGRSLENHLSALFDAFEIRYDTQVKTENGKKPDFLFPGASEYYNPDFSQTRLTMLAAKSSCKDRWSQILPEALRVPTKHLLTLEPAISEAQTTTMKNSEPPVQLVVPADIAESYTSKQRMWLWNVADFVKLVSERQAGSEVLV